MYEYRTWTDEQQKKALAERKQRGYPKHSPPHLAEANRFRIVTGACFEHTHFLNTPKRLAWFEEKLLAHLDDQSLQCDAWVVLPNHYHILVKIPSIKQFAIAQGQLHGRTSREINLEDGETGRQVWYRCVDRAMRSEAHYYTTVNYIHHNPVRHEYVRQWGEWPYSSYHWYLETKGRDWLVELWRKYPLHGYGDKWDV